MTPQRSSTSRWPPTAVSGGDAMFLDTVGAVISARQDAAHERFAMLAALAGKMPAEEIAAVMHTTKRAVQSLAWRNGISLAVMAKPWTDAEDAIIRRNAATMTTQQIADLLPGRSAVSVRGYAHRKGIRLYKSGERHHRCRIPDHDVELCRAMHDEGLTVKEIAEKMEINPGTVSQYVNYSVRLK